MHFVERKEEPMLINAKKDLLDYARTDAERTIRMYRKFERDLGPGRINYGLCLALTAPFLLLATLVGLFELVVRTEGDVTRWVARPFLWAVDRGRFPAGKIVR
jgi:hypothetical protein